MPKYRAVWAYKAERDMGSVEADSLQDALKIALRLVDEQPVPNDYLEDDYVTVEDENGEYVSQDM